MSYNKRHAGAKTAALCCSRPVCDPGAAKEIVGVMGDEHQSLMVRFFGELV